LFILVHTTTKSIQFINEPVFLFWFVSYSCFGFISKAATTKNRQFIYDLSMLCLGLGSNVSWIETRSCVLSCQFSQTCILRSYWHFWTFAAFWASVVNFLFIVWFESEYSVNQALWPFYVLNGRFFVWNTPSSF
jgi:hypothetical protein